MAYRIQLAKVNKESDKSPEGFQDNWSIDYGCDDFSEFYSIGDYPINNKLSTKAVQLYYSNDEPNIPISKPGFCRVKTVAYINGVPYVSTPSNVLNVKEGPAQCYLMDIAGVIYDATDAKKHQNTENKKRAQIHWKRFNKEDPGEFEWEDVYIHVKHEEDEVDMCAKNGTLFFLGIKDDQSSIKAYELLRSDSKNGTYKKVKSYALNSPELIRLETYGESEIPVYAMHYNSFVPEKTFYYAIRAVSKTGSTPGARGNAIKKETKFDRGRLEAMVKALPEGYVIRRIDSEIYDLCLKEEQFKDCVSVFGSKEKYLELGRGFVVMKDGKIVSSASSYSRFLKGIDIEIDTAKEERHKGLGSAVASKLILACLDEGLYPAWDAANKLSVRLAEKLGYEYSREYICYGME